MPKPLHDKDGFFKYYSVEAAKLTLRNVTRKWSSPLLFNDPFDNQIDLLFEEPTKDVAAKNLELFQQVLRSTEPFEPGQFGSLTDGMELLRQIYVQNPGLTFTEEEIAELIEGEIGDMHRVLKTAEESNSEIHRILADTSIFCVSETHDNLLMWSHYAENHRAAVIKFLPLPEVDSPLMMAQSVRYSANMPRLSFASLMDLEAAKREVLETITLSKSVVWSYEREWRVVAGLLDKSVSYEVLPYAAEEVGAVYLGCNMAGKDKDEIVDITRHRFGKAKIYQAEKHQREFALLFREVS